MWLHTDDGRTFLDANSGLWHLSLGYRPTAIEPAVLEALNELGGSSLFRRSHVWAERLVETLADLVALSAPRFFFGTSGSEASDIAMRIALAYGHKNGRDTFAFIPGAYHGVSLGPLSLMGLEGYRNGVMTPVSAIALPPIAEWERDSAGCAETIAGIFSSCGAKMAAVFVEFIQGSGGMSLLPPEYASFLAEVARTHSALLVLDEVATGVYRTGPFLAFGSSHVPDADMIVLGKGLTSGIAALSVVGVAERVWRRVLDDPDTARVAGSTHAGNPVACAAAQATLEYLAHPETAMLRAETARHLADALRGLAKVGCVARVTGMGHMWGIAVSTPARTAIESRGHTFVDAVTRLGLDEGVLLHPLSIGVIPVVPALTISPDEVDILRDRLNAVLQHLAQ